MSEDLRIILDRVDAQRIFDLAVAADQACSGYMDSDDVAAMRRLAVALGVDPRVCTGEEFVSQFPHRFEPGAVDYDVHRQTIVTSRPDVGALRNIETRRAETDEEVAARLGRTPEVLCRASYGRCRRPENHPCHDPGEDA